MRTEPHKRGNVIFERIYEIITYEDSTDLNTEVILKFIFNKFPGIEWAYAYHDKDVNEDGTPKKPHTHIIIRFPREKSINAVAKALLIKPSQINWKASFEGSIQYLVHYNNPEKYQYNRDVITTNISSIDSMFKDNRSRSDIAEEKERNELSAIVEYIAYYDGVITMYMLYKFCVDNGIWSTYRRNYSIIKDMLYEGREWKKRGKDTYWYESI